MKTAMVDNVKDAQVGRREAETPVVAASGPLGWWARARTSWEGARRVGRVSWPTQREVQATTIVVILLRSILGIYLFAVDAAFTRSSSGSSGGSEGGMTTDVSTPSNWYIVHTYSGFEKKVKESLEQRVQAYGLEDEFGEVLMPKEDVVEMRGGRKTRRPSGSSPATCSSRC